MKVWQCDDSRPVPGLVQAEVKKPGPQRGNRPQLCDIAAMLDVGQLRPVVGAVLPFARAAAAYTREPMRDRRPGKTVVTLIPPS